MKHTSSGLAAVAALIATLSACRYPATQVTVAVDSDAPRDRALSIRVTALQGARTDGDGEVRSWVAGGDSPTARLPATFAVVPADGEPRDGVATLLLDAQLAATPEHPVPVSFRRIARFAFTPHAATVVPIFLSLTCGSHATGCTATPADACTIEARCEELGETCGDLGTCTPVDVEPQPSGNDAGAAADATADGASTSWPRFVSSPTHNAVWGAVADGEGNVYVAGDIFGPADFSGATASAGAGDSAFLASYTRAGQRRWVSPYGNPAAGSVAVARALALGDDGTLWAAGHFGAPTGFGGPVLDPGMGQDLFVARYDLAGGYEGAEHAGGSNNVQIHALALGASGAYAVAGFYGGVDTNLGAGPLRPSSSDDVFVASYASPGALRWSRGFGGDGLDVARAVALDAAGNVYVAGQCTSGVDLGGGTTNTGRPDHDAFVASYGPSGAYRWGAVFGSAMEDDALGLVLEPGGDCVVVGRVGGPLVTGGSVMGAPLGGADGFALALAPADGTVRWSRRIGGPGDDDAAVIDVDDASGALYVAGHASAGATIDGRALASAAYVLALPAGGTPAMGVHTFGGSAAIQLGAIRWVPATASVLIAGQATGAGTSVVIDGVTHPIVGGADGFVDMFRP